MPSFKKSLIVEQFQGNYLKRDEDACRKIEIKPLRETNVGVAQNRLFCRQSSRLAAPCMVCQDGKINAFFC